MFTTLFIIAALIETAVIIGCLATERIGASFFSVLAFLVVLQFGWTGYELDVLRLFLSNIPLAIGIFAAYIAAGGIYSVVRWYFRVRRQVKEIRDLKVKADKIQVDKTLPGTSLNQSEEWHIRRAEDEKGRILSDIKQRTYRLRPSDNKALLTGWIAFWPFDSLIFVFEEPVQRMFRFLSNLYLHITKSALQEFGLDTTDIDP